MDAADAGLFPNHVQDHGTLSITAIFIISVFPQWFIRQTRCIRYILTGFYIAWDYMSCLRSRCRQRRETRICTLLGSGLKNIPDIVTITVAGHDVPVPQPPVDTINDYMTRRKLVIPHIFLGVQHFLDGTAAPTVTMPGATHCLHYLRLCLQNSPSHWLVQTENGDNGKWLELDATPSLDTIESAPMGCIYNVRKIRLADDCSWVEFEVLDGSSWKWPDNNSPDELVGEKKLQTFTFFALVLLQQLSETCYHNWVHFYFNDVVLSQVKSLFPSGHWVRTLLNPHMRYQEVLNQAGMFSRGPNDPSQQTLLDDVLYPGMLSNWPLDLFQRDIIDSVLGYYKGADHSRIARIGKAMGFDLSDILNNRHTNKRLPSTPMRSSIDSLQTATQNFVHGIVVQHESVESDRISLFNRGVLRYLDTEATDTFGSGTQNIFVNILSRYILNVGHLHGLEHYMMNLPFAPLRLPQRIREVYTSGLSHDAYFHRSDALNGMYGHRIYTRFRPGPIDAREDWENIQYDFMDMASSKLAGKYIADVRTVHASIRDKIVSEFHTIWDSSNIDWSCDKEYLKFSSKYMGLSICM